MVSVADFHVFLIVFIAVVVGYFLGRWKSQQEKEEVSPLSFPQKKYLQGVTQLLNEQADEAIDVFTSVMPVNQYTLETHMALAGVLRKRGEFDRAIRIHQGLLERPVLNSEQQREVQMELAVDYLRSGLLDRAEQLLRDFVDHKSRSRKELHTALCYLVEIYQLTKEWKQAIDIADRLTVRKFGAEADSWRVRQAHYCCELAEELYSIDPESAEAWAKSALSYDKSSVRASLLKARYRSEVNDWLGVLDCLELIPRQDARFVSEMIPLYYECCIKLDMMPQFVLFLEELYEEGENLLALKFLLKTFKPNDVTSEDIDFLVREVGRYKGLLPLGQLLGVVDKMSPVARENFEKIQGVLEACLSHSISYRCQSCGYKGGQVHWVCPSCKSWSTVVLSS